MATKQKCANCGKEYTPPVLYDDRGLCYDCQVEAAYSEIVKYHEQDEYRRVERIERIERDAKVTFWKP